VESFEKWFQSERDRQKEERVINPLVCLHYSISRVLTLKFSLNIFCLSLCASSISGLFSSNITLSLSSGSAERNKKMDFVSAVNGESETAWIITVCYLVYKICVKPVVEEFLLVLQNLRA
jgi:hypothetical protein